MAVAIISRNQTTSWLRVFVFLLFLCRLIALPFTGERIVPANPMNICRHTRPVVCGDRCRSFWICAHGLSCFATVREQQGSFCIFLASQYVGVVRNKCYFYCALSYLLFPFWVEHIASTFIFSPKYFGSSKLDSPRMTPYISNLISVFFCCEFSILIL